MKKGTTTLILAIIMLAAGRLGAQSLSEDLLGQADIVVDMNGNGDYTTVQAGLNAVPDFNDEWIVVLVRKGVYYEKVILNHKKTKVILVGEDVDSTIITYDDWGDKMLVDGDPARGGHTFSTYTFRADPHEFQAYNITFENTTLKGQGVAFHSNGDKQILHHCRLLGFQDTYFDNFRTRRYMKDCYIEGATDFIFGWGVTLFDSCQIHASAGGWITASSTPEHYEFGHVFKDCRITSGFRVTGGVYLGRPWFPYANTMFYECWLPETIPGRGWSDWDFRGETCIYREYNNFGPGADTTERIEFGRQLDPSLADRYVADTILAASNFPADLGPVVDSVELWSVRDRFEASGYTARADTILYAGREQWPEYPADDWSPVFYDSIHSIITRHTFPFMDSIHGLLEIGTVFADGTELEGFRQDSLEYVVEIPSGDTVLPVFTVTGNGVSYETQYPREIPGNAILTVTSYDRTRGQEYEIYLSQDSIYWSTTPKYVVINWDDTVYFEKGIFQYDTHLPVGDDRFRNGKVVRYPGQESSYTKPDGIPGEMVITMVSASKTDTAQYIIFFTPWAGLEQQVLERSRIRVLNPVSDRLLLSCSEPLAGRTLIGIYDIRGRLVWESRLEDIGTGMTELPEAAERLDTGLYIYRVQTGEEGVFATGKLLKLGP